MPEADTQPKDLRSSIRTFTQKLAERVERFANDLSTLEVRTYTTPHDQVEVLLQEDPDIGQIATEGKVALRAYTQIGFDSDTTICLPLNEAGEIDRSVWEMHQAMVNLAMTNRATMLRAVSEAATSAFNALTKAQE
jgi:hypothetical protein